MLEIDHGFAPIQFNTVLSRRWHDVLHTLVCLKVPMRHALILTTFFAFFLPGPAWSQTKGPYPNPRPDRAALAVEAEVVAEQLKRGGDTTLLDQFEPNVVTVQTASPETASNAITDVLAGPAQPVTLSAKITEDGALIPGGLIWRIFSTAPNQDNQMELVDTSRAPTSVFSLPPGEYLAHVAYGQAQKSHAIIVEQSPSAQTIVLDAGGLRLTSAISGDVVIPDNALHFSIFPDGSDGRRGTAIVQDLPPGEMIRLNAGVYHVVSHFGDINAIVEANLRVEPGQLTEATLYHNASQVSFRLVSEAGGDAIADVEWTVTDAAGETIFKELGAFPSAILAAGNYTVLARQNRGVFNRDFAITPGPAREIEVLTQFYSND